MESDQEHDVLGDAIERLEWDDQRSRYPASRFAQITRRTALTGTAAGLAATLLEACGSSSAGTQTNPAGAAATVFGNDRAYRFTMVSHAKANELFAPTQNGAADACQLLGCSYEWTGSESTSVAQMVGAINTAVSVGVDGIATTIIDQTAFDAPIADAFDAGIPVLTYNADSLATHRLAYIGQDLYLSGQEMGRRIISLMPGGGEIALFIATPGTANLQPRVDGVKNALHGSDVKLNIVGSGVAATQDMTTIEKFVHANPSYKGFFAVDSGSTAAVATAIQKYGLRQKNVVGGGVDLVPTTQQLLAGGYIDFSIDQQPYLQGFLPILELYLHRVSRGLTGTADVDTGIRFVDRETVGAYEKTQSRFEGTGTSPGVS